MDGEMILIAAPDGQLPAESRIAVNISLGPNRNFQPFFNRQDNAWHHCPESVVSQGIIPPSIDM
jgi:hypothetical protein